MSVLAPWLTAFLVFICFCSASGNESTRVVSDCIQLQEALSRHHVKKVVVKGAIRCTRKNWPVPVVVQRGLEITGDPGAANSTEGEQASIDWTDTSHVVIAERSSISIHDIVLRQNDVGVGLTLSFIHTREGAAAVFAGVVMIVKRCSQPVWTYHSLIANIDRPNFLTGTQKTQTIGGNVLLMQDIALWWPNLNSVWQLCNGILVCLDGYEGEIPVEEYFGSGLVVDTCAEVVETPASSLTGVPGVSGEQPAVNEQVDQETEDEESKGRKGTKATSNTSTSTSSTIIVVAVVTGVVLLITAVLSYKFICGRSALQVRAHQSKRDLSSIEDGSPRDGTSSRFLSNKNDMDLDLFERGTNTVPLQDVVIGSLLGRGGFGKVYKGTWKGTSVAIKVIEHGERLLQNELKLPFEAYLSRHISHPNVVQTFLIHTRQKDSQNGITVDTLDFHADSPGSGKKNCSAPSLDVFSNMAPPAAAGHDAGDIFQTWLVLEFCDRGSLSRAIRKGDLLYEASDSPLLDHILLSALDVANAMNYLHSLGITHGDLKAENVLLKSASTDRRGFFCKVSDFGLSRYVGDNDYLQTFTYGTITHMPPELLKNGAFSTAVDIYSFGVLLWELLATTPPYPENNPGHILMTVVNEGRRPQITDRYPQMYADLIKDCWKQNPDDRPKFSAIVRRLKGMIADLEIGNHLLKNNVNDSASSQEVTSRTGERHRAAAYVSTMPETSPTRVSVPPNIMFCSEPSSLRATMSEEVPPTEWPMARQDSVSLTGSVSTSPRSFDTATSDFTQESP